PFWTHILFTWTLKDGLKIYINGTFSVSDTKGNTSQDYGDTHADLVIGTGTSQSYGHYVTASFDEFVIWERALSAKEIWLYYKAAIGEDVVYPPTTESPSSIHTATDVRPQATTASPHPTASNFTEIHDAVSMSLQGFLQSSFILPNKTISKDTAHNLTQVPEIRHALGYTSNTIQIVKLFKTFKNPINGTMSFSYKRNF
ncbi:adhesion G-protein coupled receptor D1 isoform X1, partial [Tachysurus ichikawai]